jgi:hypothetical protein
VTVGLAATTATAACLCMTAAATMKGSEEIHAYRSLSFTSFHAFLLFRVEKNTSHVRPKKVVFF